MCCALSVSALLVAAGRGGHARAGRRGAAHGALRWAPSGHARARNARRARSPQGAACSSARRAHRQPQAPYNAPRRWPRRWPRRFGWWWRPQRRAGWRRLRRAVDAARLAGGLARRHAAPVPDAAPRAGNEAHAQTAGGLRGGIAGQRERERERQREGLSRVRVATAPTAATSRCALHACALLPATRAVHRARPRCRAERKARWRV